MQTSHLGGRIQQFFAGRSERWRSGNRLNRPLPPETAKWEQALALDQCEISDEVGKGHFGATHVIRDKGSKTARAVIKVFKPDPHKSKEENKRAKAKFESDIEEEAAFYAKVGDHPNIVKCAGVQTVDGQKGLVLEYVNGANAEKTANKMREDYQSGKLSQEQYWGAAQYSIRQTLHGLEHLEKAGVVHNDIKPDNIMIDAATGEVKLIDFGLATEAGEETEEGRKGGILRGQIPVAAGTTAPEFINSPGSTEKGDQTGHGGAIMDPAADRFGLAGVAHLFGEGTKPLYGAAQGTDPVQAIQNYAAQPAAGADAPQLLHAAEGKTPDDDPQETSNAAFNLQQKTVEVPDKDTGLPKTLDTWTRTKKPGQFAGGMSTSYVNFVNAIGDRDPSKRPTVTDLLGDPELGKPGHPFLTESLLEDEEARQVLRGQMPAPATPPAPAPAAAKASPFDKTLEMADGLTKMGNEIFEELTKCFNDLLKLQKVPHGDEKKQAEEMDEIKLEAESLGRRVDHWVEHVGKIDDHLTNYRKLAPNQDDQNKVAAAQQALNHSGGMVLRVNSQLRARLEPGKGGPPSAGEVQWKMLNLSGVQNVRKVETEAESRSKQAYEARAAKIDPLLKELRNRLEQQEGPEVTEERERVLLRLRDEDSPPPDPEEIKQMLSLLPKLREEAQEREERRLKLERQEAEKKREEEVQDEALKQFFEQIGAALKANGGAWTSLEEFGKARVPGGYVGFATAVKFHNEYDGLAGWAAAYKERTGVAIIAPGESGGKAKD